MKLIFFLLFVPFLLFGQSLDFSDVNNSFPLSFPDTTDYGYPTASVDTFKAAEALQIMADIRAALTKIGLGSDVAGAATEVLIQNAGNDSTEWRVLVDGDIPNTITASNYVLLTAVDDSIATLVADSSLINQTEYDYITDDTTNWKTAYGWGDWSGEGFITATLTEEQVEDYVGGMVTSNTETNITVTYQDDDGTIDFVVSAGTYDSSTVRAEFDTLAGKTGDKIILEDTLQLASGAVISGIGTISVDSANIDSLVVTDWISVPDDAFTADDLQNSGQTDEYVLSYEETGDSLQWKEMAGGGDMNAADFDDSLSSVISVETIEDSIGSMLTGNTETGITVTYQDADGTIDFAVTQSYVLLTAVGDSVEANAYYPGGTDVADADVADDITASNYVLLTAFNDSLSGALQDSAFALASELTSYVLLTAVDDSIATLVADSSLVNQTDYDLISDDTTDFKTAFGWGDWSARVSNIEDDTTQWQTNTTNLGYVLDDTTNWKTAFGWGDWSGEGFITATLTEEEVEDYVGGMVTGNTETNITVTYQDDDGTIDFVVSGGGDMLKADMRDSVYAYLADSIGVSVQADLGDTHDTSSELDALYEAELTNSAGLLAALSDETGTGVAVFGTAPTFTTSITIGSAGISEAELEIIDGATITTAQLNALPAILDDTTAWTAKEPALTDVASLQSTISDVTTFYTEDTTVPVADGGTGVNTLTDGGILIGNGTEGLVALGVATNGQIPIGDGTTDPVLANITETTDALVITNGAGTIVLSAHANLEAIADGTDLPVAQGGTGASSLDNLIDSDSYVDGSIDAVHLSNNARTILDTVITDTCSLPTKYHYGGVVYVTGASFISLDAVADGMNMTFITIGAILVEVNPDDADLIVLDGTAASDGEHIANTSTTGDMAVITYYNATGFYAASGSNDGDEWGVP